MFVIYWINFLNILIFKLGVNSLPQEVRRNFALLRELDIRSQGMFIIIFIIIIFFK